MAVSGQYAAAQLAKLDRSPLFRGRHFPLAQEIAAYLGNVTPLMPPTFLRWSRVLGRRVSITTSRGIIVFIDELQGIDCTVQVSYTEFDGLWRIHHATGTVEEYYRAGRGFLFDAVISTMPTVADQYFYNDWWQMYRIEWPLIAGNVFHPILARFVAPFHRFLNEYFDHGNLHFREIRRRNRAIVPPTESDSDFGEEL